MPNFGWRVTDFNFPTGALAPSDGIFEELYGDAITDFARRTGRDIGFIEVEVGVLANHLLEVSHVSVNDAEVAVEGFGMCEKAKRQRGVLPSRVVVDSLVQDGELLRSPVAVCRKAFLAPLSSLRLIDTKKQLTLS